MLPRCSVRAAALRRDPNRRGAALRSVEGAPNPVFVSVGHRIRWAAHRGGWWSELCGATVQQLTVALCLLSPCRLYFFLTACPPFLTACPPFFPFGRPSSLPTAVKLTTMCSRHRLPEPVRLADQFSRTFLRENYTPENAA